MESEIRVDVSTAARWLGLAPTMVRSLSRAHGLVDASDRVALHAFETLLQLLRDPHRGRAGATDRP